MLVAASVLSLRTTQAQSNSDDVSSFQAWQQLQDTMPELGASPAPEALSVAEAQVIGYQLALAEENRGSQQLIRDAVAAEAELSNADFSNPLGILFCSIEFETFENDLVNVREGSTKTKVNFFNDDTNALIQDIRYDFTVLQQDLLNFDGINPAALEQRNADMINYRLDVEKLVEKAHHYKKAALKDAVDVAALTPEEQQLWNQFHLKLAKKCKAACKNALSQIPNSEGGIDPLTLQNNFEQAEKINASAETLKILEQGCLYEFLNVLIAKRSDVDSSLNSFNQLQKRLDQFLNNVDTNNLVALLQAQVDMLAYEKEVAAGAVSK